MSNFNTRRRKAKKQARGNALALAFAGLSYSRHMLGKSRLPALPRVLCLSNAPATGLWDKAWFNELEAKKDPCPSCSCDRNLKGCFCFEESTSIPIALDDPRRGWFNCAGKYVMPEVIYAGNRGAGKTSAARNFVPMNGPQRVLMEAPVEPMDILYGGVTGKPLLKKKDFRKE